MTFLTRTFFSTMVFSLCSSSVQQYSSLITSCSPLSLTCWLCWESDLPVIQLNTPNTIVFLFLYFPVLSAPACRFQTVQGLLYYIQTEWERLYATHTTAYTTIHGLKALVSEDQLVNEVALCCLRVDNNVPPPTRKCRLCRAEAKLKDYEYRLFLFTDRLVLLRL